MTTFLTELGFVAKRPKKIKNEDLYLKSFFERLH